MQEVRINTFLKQENPLLDLPAIDQNAVYLIDLFTESGMYERGDYGIRELSWCEIEHFNSVTKSGLSAFESTILRKMSVNYVSSKYAGEDGMSQPPYSNFEDLDTEFRGVVENNLRSFFSSFKLPKGKKPKGEVQKAEPRGRSGVKDSSQPRRKGRAKRNVR